MSDETKPETKPGYKTTEFWLTMLASVVGAVMAFVPNDSKVMQILGIVTMILTALGYTVVRGGVKKSAKMLMIVLLPLCIVAGGSGCHKGEILVSNVAPLTTDVCDRHDKLITGQLDPKSISEADKATYLRSSQLLRKVLSEAQK